MLNLVDMPKYSACTNHYLQHYSGWCICNELQAKHIYEILLHD
jgi:hypothetical protein